MKFLRKICVINEIRIYFLLTLIILLVKIIFLEFHLKRSTLLTPDSMDYLLAGNNFIGTYFSSTRSELLLSLYRLPGYPFIISLIGSTHLLIYAQIFAHSLIGIISVLVLRQIFNVKSKTVCLLAFIFIQIETSLIVYSYRVLSDLFFALLILLLTYTVLAKQKYPNYKCFDYILIFLLISSFLFRPTSVALIITFGIMAVISKNRKYFFRLFIYSSLIFLAYSSFNLIKSGVFTYTLVQNQNFLIYEGIGSKAINSQLQFEKLIEAEIELRNVKLANNMDLNEINSYNLNRGLELINNNRLAFAKMHAIGLLKVLYGPNRYEFIDIISDNGRLKFSKMGVRIILGISFLITFLISSLGLFSVFRIFLFGDSAKFIVILIFSFVLISSSSIGYGRFRTPISALLITCIALKMSRLSIKCK